MAAPGCLKGVSGAGILPQAAKFQKCQPAAARMANNRDAGFKVP